MSNYGVSTEAMQTFFFLTQSVSSTEGRAASLTGIFYMGKNTPERRDFIVHNLAQEIDA